VGFWDGVCEKGRRGEERGYDLLHFSRALREFPRRLKILQNFG